MTQTTTAAERAAKAEAEALHAYYIADPNAEELYRRAARLWRRVEGVLGEAERRCVQQADRLKRENARLGIRSGCRL